MTPAPGPDEPSTEDPQESLSRKAGIGGALLVGAQMARTVILLGTTVVLARLLRPADFGLIALFTVIAGLLQNLQQFGLQLATIQKKRLEAVELERVFSLSFYLGAATFLLALVAAPGLARAVNEPDLRLVMMICSLRFLFNGVGLIPSAILKRRMRFGTVAVNDMLSAVGGAAVALFLALRGFGVWALVAQLLVESFVATAHASVSCGWRPRRLRHPRGIGSMIAFGRGVTLYRFVDYFTRNLDRWLIAFLWDARILGLYSKPMQILKKTAQRFSTPVAHVAISTLSRLQDEPERFRRFFRQALMYTASVHVPLLTFAALQASDCVLVVLGEQWTEAVPILRVLALGVLANTFRSPANWVFLSLGRAKRQWKWALIEFALTGLALATFGRRGLWSLALVYSAAAISLRLPAMAYCMHGTFLNLGDVGRSVWRPLLAGALAVGATAAASPQWSAGTPVLRLAASAAVYLVVYAGCWLALPNGRQELVFVWRTLRRGAGESKTGVPS